jgi:hypothetical protein
MNLPMATSLDVELWHEALEHILQLPPDRSAPAIVGAAAALLHQAGKLTATDLQRLIRGYLPGASTAPASGTGCLQGVLAVVPELLWQSPSWLAFFDELFAELSEDQFLNVLPELRLAFSQLHPRDLSRIAGQVELLLSPPRNVAARSNRVGPAERELAQRLTAEVTQSLQRDHLLQVE